MMHSAVCCQDTALCSYRKEGDKQSDLGWLEEGLLLAFNARRLVKPVDERVEPVLGLAASPLASYGTS